MGIMVLILESSFVLGTLLPLTLTTSNFIKDQDSAPEFTNVLQNISVPIERDVTFTCNVKNIGKYKVGWVKADTKAIQAIGDSVITHNEGVSVSGDFVSTFNLHIKEVTRDDGGLYMCQINTDPMTSQSAWLSVLIPPDIDTNRTSGDITAHEHEDTARLTCHARGVPRPKIVWRREGGGKIRIRSNHHQQRSVDVWSGDTLEIHRVRREDMGAYLCIATNDVPPTVSQRIYLHVQFSPSILPGLSVLGSAPGNPLTLECIVEGYPKPLLVWSFGDKILHSEDEAFTMTDLPLSMYRTSSKLTLKNYHEGLKGIYTCRATNSLGHAESSTRVYTAPEPLVPRREPKYEIIVEKKEKVTLVKQNINEHKDKKDNLQPKKVDKPTKNNEKQRTNKIQNHQEERTQKKFYGLLSSGCSIKNEIFILSLLIILLLL